MYIDVDMDSHSVVSLSGDKDTEKQYMMSAGMISSLYESTVWEQITGYESVSTISILAKAKEQGIDILLISHANMSTELEKLNVSETTRQEVINAVNSGKTVTISSEEIEMGDWSGSGYIVMNPETGAGAYMISGGLNGGALAVLLGLGSVCATFSSVMATSMLVMAAVQFFGALLATGPFALIVLVAAILALGVVEIIDLNKRMWKNYMDYMFTGNLDSASSTARFMSTLGNIALAEVSVTQVLNKKIAEKAVVEGSTGSSNRIFETIDVNSQNIVNGPNAFNRFIDTESKILEDIAHQLGYNTFSVDKSVVGNVYLITERAPCPSCERVIAQFKEMFPNVNVEIKYMY